MKMMLISGFGRKHHLRAVVTVRQVKYLWFDSSLTLGMPAQEVAVRVTHKDAKKPPKGAWYSWVDGRSVSRPMYLAALALWDHQAPTAVEGASFHRAYCRNQTLEMRIYGLFIY